MGGLRKGEPVQSWVHLEKSTMPGCEKGCQIGSSEQQVHLQLCVAFGVQGTHLAVYSCVQFALTGDWEALGKF